MVWQWWRHQYHPNLVASVGKWWMSQYPLNHSELYWLLWVLQLFKFDDHSICWHGITAFSQRHMILQLWNYQFLSKKCYLIVWYPNRRLLPVCSHSVTIILAKNFCVLPESHDLKMIMSWLSFKLVWIEYVTLSLPAVQIWWHSSFAENGVMVFFHSHKI